MIAPASSRASIYDYLTPDLAAHLNTYGDLTPDARDKLGKDLRHRLATYMAYIPQRLVRVQLANPMPGRVSGSFWRGSLLFADMSGFTALSQQLSALDKQGAEEISSIINRLFDALLAEVHTYQGTLLKFGGDALTVFFDTDTGGEMHASAAACAALAMQKRMQDFSAVETPVGTFRLGLRVGVHSGQVFAAEVGDSSHIELVVTGREVNRVAAAQEIAVPGEVVVSHQTAALLPGAQLLPRAAGFHLLRALPAIQAPVRSAGPVLLDGPNDMLTISLLADQVTALQPYLVRSLPRRFLDVSSTELGEFRPVTVLFANFHNFSALLDLPGITAEHAAHLLNAYFQRAQAVVHRYDGIINKVDMYTHGDKLMALFGAPVAHEDDPLRAVRCALDMKAMLNEANEELAASLGEGSPFPGLHQHIGINTGIVFAGRVGGAQRYEYTVMGPAVNLAARLMAAASDGMVLLSPTTRAAVEHQIDIQDHTPLQLKGLPEPVVPGLAVRAREVERSTTRQGLGFGQTRLVGRHDELSLLKNAAREALQGAGRVLALVGEAGIGKSRLSDELTTSLVMSSRPDRLLSAVPPFAIFTHDCQSYEQNIPYVLIRSLLRHLFTFDKPENLDSEPQSTASAALLEQIGAEVQNLAAPFVRFTPLLGDVLNVALPETPLTQSLTPEQRYHRLQELLVALLLGVARREPLLLSLENIQWADEPSREVLGRLSRAMHQVPLLLLVNYRPSPPIDQPWKGDASTVLLELSELSQEKSIDMLTALLGGPPPPAILPLLERTQGNPLYIEELMRTLVISGALIRNGGGQWHLARPLDQAAIPSSIQGLIVARLDSLPESRYELVQTASVIGRRFQHHILSRVYDSPSLLDESLHDLIRDEIVLTDSLRYDGDYLFRHAMVCDVAYEAVLYARRRELHLRVATCVEMLHTIKTDETLALLARHYLLAEVWEPAFHYHMAAGKQAQRRYANRDALALFATAIDIVLRIQAADETHSMFEQVIELHERSGDISMLLGETDQAEQSYLNALVLLNQWRKEHGLWRTEQDRRFMLPAPFAEINIRLHRLMASLEEQRSNYDSAFDWLDRGVSWSTDDTRRELARCYLLGTRIYYRQGNFNRSLDWAQRGLALAESLGTTEDQALALRLIGVLWSDLGEFGNSLKALERARVLWDQVHDVNGLNKILNDLGTVYNDMSRLGDAIACYEQSLQISENIADAHAIASTSNNLAVVLVKRGELQRADELYRYSGEQYRRIGSAWGIALTDYNQGEVLLLQQRPAEALELFQSSIAAFERMQARTFLPEVLRLAAEASLALGQADQAHDYAEQSYTLANDLGMTVEAAVALRALGQVALWRQDFPGAQSYLECSRVALEQSDNRYELGRLLLAEARLAHATGQQHIISALRQAADIFTALDAQFDLNMVYTHAMSYGIEPGKLGNLTRPSDGNDGNPPHS